MKIADLTSQFHKCVCIKSSEVYYLEVGDEAKMTNDSGVLHIKWIISIGSENGKFMEMRFAVNKSKFVQDHFDIIK